MCSCKKEERKKVEGLVGNIEKMNKTFYHLHTKTDMNSAINIAQVVETNSLMKEINHCEGKRAISEVEVTEVDDKLIGDDRIAMKVLIKKGLDFSENPDWPGNSNY